MFVLWVFLIEYLYFKLKIEIDLLECKFGLVFKRELNIWSDSKNRFKMSFIFFGYNLVNSGGFLFEFL